MSQNVAILDPQVAAKIAAGEVIERPAAVVRELLDNAIDSGASEVSLYIEEGGLQLIRVTDNGIGMSKEDLELCYLAHATSKIRHTNDLLQLGSLGFRGEALSSIAACSQLRIGSAQAADQDLNNSIDGSTESPLKAWELRVDDSLLRGIEPVLISHSGTQVEVRELFYSFPARRKFLKSTRSELSSCKAVFQEKVLAFPHIHFRLYNQGKMEHSLAPGSAVERICQVFNELVPEQLFQLDEQTENFSIQIFAASPALYRRDRKRMPIYINQRPIAEASLQQAIRIGYDGYLAGGFFPVAICFLAVSPERVDFNIHPAKREARLRDLSLIQAGIRQTLRSFCREIGNLSDPQSEAKDKRQSQVCPERTPQGPKTNSMPEQEPVSSPHASNRDAGATATRYRNSSPANRVASRSFCPKGPSTFYDSPAFQDKPGADFDSARKDFSTRELQHGQRVPPNEARVQNDDDFSASSLRETHTKHWQVAQFQRDKPQEFHYLGQLFEVFLLVQRDINDTPSLMIVDQHASHERILYETLEREMLRQQPLLVPIELDVELTESQSLRRRAAALASIGIQIKECDDGKRWQICSLPPCVNDLKDELVQLVLHGASEVEDLKRELFAHLSCRKAIKKGDILDDISATQLLHDIFTMGLERCPHGRPLWYSLSLPELYRLLQRT